MAAAAVELVDLREALRLVGSEPDLRAGEYVVWFCDAFGCRQRAARDALSVLARAGYLNVEPDAADRRRRRYQISELGRQVLDDHWGPALLRLARRMFSSCRRNKTRSSDGDPVARLRRAEHHLLGRPPFVVPSALPLLDDLLPLDRAPASPPPPPPRRVISEPRCKVCRSPYRAEIDLRIAAGQRQADVRRSINTLLGAEHFNADNISRHVRSHFHEAADPDLQRLLRQRVASEDEARRQLYQQLTEIIQNGLDAVLAGIVTVKPREMMRAITYLEQRKASAGLDLDEALSDFEALTEAVREVVGDELWQEILERHRKLSQLHLADSDYARRRRLVEPDFTFS